ncbi:MAG: hypothetical protein Q9173_001687 [Seirophora scorigena]
MANCVRSNTIFIVKPLNPVAVTSLKSTHNAKTFDFHDGLEEFGRIMKHQSHLGLECTSSLPTASGTELHVQFNPGPRNASQGFVFGSDTRFCDVHLPDILVDGKWQGISGQHFRIGFDLDARLLEVHNESPDGTRVLTPSHASRPRVLRQSGKHVINALEYTQIVAGRLKFEIVIPLRRGCYRQYEENWNTFRDECRMTVPFLGQLFRDQDIRRARHGKNHWERYYLQKPGHLDDTKYRSFDGVGQGLLGQTAQVSGPGKETLAVKLPHWPVGWNARAYLEEVISKGISHEHIVHVVGLLYDSEYPEFGSKILATEFFELGSLADLKDVSAEEVGVTLLQSLQALAFLHDDKNMKHGNIKSTNILVQSRAPALVVKLSGFLLTPLYVYLDKRSFYGRGPYTAPHMSLSWEGTTAIDIWALGVVGYEMIDYPRPLRRCVSRDWPIVVNAAVNNETSKAPSAQPLLRRMLTMEATERPSAKECLLDPWLRSLSSPSSTEPPSKLLCHPDQEAIRALPTTEPCFPGQVAINPSSGQPATPHPSVKEEMTIARTREAFQAGSNRQLKALDTPVAQSTRSAITKDMSRVVKTRTPNDSQLPATTHAKAYDQAITSSGGRVSGALPTPEEYDEMQKGDRKMQISKKQCTAHSIQQRSRLGDHPYEDVHKGERR